MFANRSIFHARFALIAWAALGAALGAAAFGGPNVYYRTTDPNGQSPRQDPAGWTVMPGNNFPATVNNTQCLWIGLMNRETNGSKKVVTVDLTYTGGNQNALAAVQSKGYLPNGNPINGHFAIKGVRKQRIVFNNGCPKWEYVKYKNLTGSNQSYIISPKITSTCSGSSSSTGGPGDGDAGTLEIGDGAFGVPGDMQTPQRITELWIFPESTETDPIAPHEMIAPQHTGNWNPEIVFHDPDGLPRPIGGVRWTTDGFGLTEEDAYSLSLHTLERADSRFTIYTFDPDAVVVDEYLWVSQGRWLEAFEAFDDDYGLHGQDAWQGWDDDPAFDAPVTRANPRRGEQSLEVEGDADIVRVFDEEKNGAWSFSAWQYIPSDFESGDNGRFTGSYFNLLNTYNADGPYHWSVQIQADPRDGLLKVFHGDDINTINVPYIEDRWVKIQAEIDLDDDWTRIYYDDELVTEYAWTGGVLGDGGGVLDIAAIDLYAFGSSSVYYDDLILEPIFNDPCPGDLDGDGDTDADDFFAYLDGFANDVLDVCDIDGDGDCDADDFFGYLDLFSAGC